MSEVNEFRSEAAETFGEIGSELEKLTTSDVLGSVVTVYGFKVLDSEFNDGKYAVIDVSPNDSEGHFIYSTGSGVIMKQLTHNRENLPFRAGIEERNAQNSSNTYLTFTSV